MILLVIRKQWTDSTYVHFSNTDTCILKLYPFFLQLFVMAPLCLLPTVSLLDGETGSGSVVLLSREYLPMASGRDSKRELGLLRKSTTQSPALWIIVDLHLHLYLAIKLRMYAHTYTTVLS